MTTLDVNDYLLDVNDVDWSTTLSPWLFLIPDKLTIWLVNRFGDIFAALDDGSIHMLDIGCGTFDRVADSRENFRSKLDIGEHANQWFMLPLINKLVAAGKQLKKGYCYGYARSPVLGGDYTVENTIVIPIHEHYGLNASIHTQIMGLPDGSPVRLKISYD